MLKFTIYIYKFKIYLLLDLRLRSEIDDIELSTMYTRYVYVVYRYHTYVRSRVSFRTLKFSEHLVFVRTFASMWFLCIMHMENDRIEFVSIQLLVNVNLNSFLFEYFI